MKNKIFLLLITLLFSHIVASDATILQPGSVAPTFSLPDLTGDRLSLRLFCGDTLLKAHLNNPRQIVILSYLATYCIPCQKEIPELMRFQENHKSDNIKVLLISVDKEGAEIVAPFVKQKGYTLPILLDPYRKTAERYGVSSVPSLFVIDPYGKILFSTLGFDEDVSLSETLESIVDGIRSNGFNQQSLSVSQSVANLPKHKISAVERWEAVCKIECGSQAAEVAKLYKVTPEELSAWRLELKAAAALLWKTDIVNK